MKVIKELVGYSGSQVLLIQDPDVRVRKIGNVDRNLERYRSLATLNLPLPKILSYTENSYDMEYISCLDMGTYLLTNRVTGLADFLKSTIDQLSSATCSKDYQEVYDKKLQQVNFDQLQFTKDQLLERLPALLPQSHYHGDLTLENVLYDLHNDRFVLIDPLTTDYDSWVFDLAKLRQDVSCQWFIRHQQYGIHSKLDELAESLEVYEYFNNDSILILMLLRVLPYVQGNDRDYIINKANKLWK